MKGLIILLVAIAGISASPALKFSLVDSLLDTVKPIFDNISSAAYGLFEQLTNIIKSLKDQSLYVLALAAPILRQLVNDIKDHAADAVPLLTSTIAQLTSLIGAGKRGVFDAVFGPVLSLINEVASGLYDQFTVVANQIVNAGLGAIGHATPIFLQLYYDIKNHAADAVPLLTSALAQLTSLVGKRGLFDGLGSIFAPILSLIQEVAGGLYGQFTVVANQIVNAGLGAIAQATPIVWQLFNDIKDHATDAIPLVSSAIAQLTNVVIAGKRGVLDSISALIAPALNTASSVAANVVDQFIAVFEKIKHSSFAVILQASPILAQLVADLQAHATDAVPLLTSAVAQLTTLVGK